MPSVSNAGGSLTSAVVLTLLAWGVRWLRNELSRHKKEEAARQRERRSPGRFHAALSPAALRMLMETGPYPHVVFDVRDADETEPLPPELRGSLRLPHNMVAQALESPNDWAQFFHGIQYPQPHFMLVFVGSSKEQQLEAAAAASSVGFERTMTLSGSLMEFSQKVTLQQNLNYISRDAVAALVSPLNEASLIPTTRAVLVDVRRSDERLLYGAIRNSVHIPVDQLPQALTLSDAEFEKQYGFAKPGHLDFVIMSCRTNTRAAWAAQLAQDAGLHRTVVYRHGVNGWRIDSSVKVYRGYKLFDQPPEPEAYQIENPDLSAGASELAALGAVAYRVG